MESHRLDINKIVEDKLNNYKWPNEFIKETYRRRELKKFNEGLEPIEVIDEDSLELKFIHIEEE